MTTFGGHPVCCAAGMAAMEALLEENMISNVAAKAQLFLQNLQHPKIKNIRHHGLMMAVELDSFDIIQKVIKELLEIGVFTDWFLFADNCIRIVPPLNIEDETIIDACKKIKIVLDKI
jgi:acetylornithine/succinyldiaminopimelate/putrescine aminotransferase